MKYLTCLVALAFIACSQTTEPPEQQYYAVLVCTHNETTATFTSGPYRTMEVCEDRGTSDIIATMPVNPEVITQTYCETR